MNRKWIVAGAACCFLGVALGAFGAHALKERLADAGRTDVWATGVDYLFMHGLAMVCAGLVHGEVEARWWSRAALAWLVGVVFFSGSLFGLALGGPGWLGPVTPLGGLAFLAGWGMAGMAGLVPRRAGGRSKGSHE